MIAPADAKRSPKILFYFGTLEKVGLYVSAQNVRWYDLQNVSTVVKKRSKPKQQKRTKMIASV